ncbi:GntR family transcriptional regulator [Maribacter thermophilus]|uniref:GntR family transcriptional regulator n=1 Tax=Maribacter thermophilus TaxID=1197874 RepID=UPI000640D2E7|nr:GntR family transcriptional regulator [Maribacter thermophilus]
MKHSKLTLSIYNNLLDDIAKNENLPRGLPTEAKLASNYSVSRSTIRKVIEIACSKGIVMKDGSNKIILRLPTKSDYFSSNEIENSKSDIAERAVLKKLYNYELKPGDKFSELEIANETNTNTVSVREALNGISHTGLIKKRAGQKWEVEALTQSKLNQLIEFRSLLENYAVNCLEKQTNDNDSITKFTQILNRHKELLQKKKVNFSDLTALEKRFHYTLIKACNNSFIESSYNSLFILINYHIGQIKYDTLKIKNVLRQHITILEAILDNDFNSAKNALQFHLDHAEKSMKEVNAKLPMYK